MLKFNVIGEEDLKARLLLEVNLLKMCACASERTWGTVRLVRLNTHRAMEE